MTKAKRNNQSKTLGKYLKSAYTRFLKIRGEPREISWGLAIGIMVGMTPFMGFHTIIAIFLAAIGKWNKIAAAVGVFITNPFTAPFIYPITYMVGKSITGFSNFQNPEKVLSLEAVINIVKSSPLILVDLLVGGIILGLPLSLAAYWISLTAIENYRKKIKPKLHKHRGRKLIPKIDNKKTPHQKGPS
jgi:uncharacterized protein